jgi:mycothiol synthase
VVETPAPVGGIRFRPASVADAAGVHALMVAAYEVDANDERETLEDVEQTLAASWFDPATDALVGVDDDDAVRAWAAALRRPGQLRTRQAAMVGVVHPAVRARGVGRALLAWQAARGEELVRYGAEPSGPDVPWMLRAWVEDRLTDRAALLRAAGFTARRFTSVMGRVLSDPLPAADLPGDVRLVRLLDGGPRLQEQVRVAHNEAFADHWGSEPIEAEDWQRHDELPGARPDLSWAAVDASEQVVGYLVSGTYRQDWEAQGYSEGWTDLLGVAAHRRGEGLGRALLCRAMAGYADEGLDRAGLAVDVENPRALGLYTGLGYVERGRETSWVRDVAKGQVDERGEVGQPPR